MSGAEALAVLSAISTVISIVDGVKKVYDAASDAKGLPSAFREVANRVPLVHETLQTAHKEIEAGSVNDATCKAMRKVVEACGLKAQNLETIFKKVLPEPDASRTDRYLMALKSLPKGSRVELLMKGILEDIQVLASNHGMKTVTNDELEKLTEAIKQMEQLPPSADDEAGGKSQSATHNADGDIYQSMEDQYVSKDSSRMTVNKADNMTFNQANMKSALLHIHTMNLFTNSMLADAELRLACEQGKISLEAVERHSSHLTRIEEECLQSLSFSRLGYHQCGLRRALDGTCSWLRNHDKFKNWTTRNEIETHFGLLMLKGGVGTGKTTVMNEAYLTAQESTSQDNKQIVAGYFAHRGGEPLEKSIGGLIRTLLLHILPKHKIMMDDLVSTYKEKRSRHGAEWQWAPQELLAFLERHLVKSGDTAFYIFIDGLDELVEDEAIELVNYFRKLTITASATGANINVCLSSRYYPNFAAELCPEIMVETENKKDIELYINEQLFTGRPINESKKTTYAKEIVETAAGAFLWVILVVSQLNKDHINGRSEAVMKSRLATNPKELNEMYTEIFKEVAEEERADVLQFWRCVVFAARPLRLTEFNHLFAFSADPPPTSLVEWSSRESTCRSGNDMIRLVNLFSKGLVTVRLKQPMVRKAEEGSTAPLELSGQFRLDSEHFRNTDETAMDENITDINNEAQQTEPTEQAENQQQEPQNYGQALFAALFNMIDWDKAINFHADLEVDAEALESGLDSLWRTFLDAGYEIVPFDETDGNNWYLEFLHISARDFFMDANGFSLIAAESEGVDFTGQGHYSIAKACFSYLDMDEMEPLAGLAEAHLKEMNFPSIDQLINLQTFTFAEYAFRFFCHHARLCEKKGISLDFLISSSIPLPMIVMGKWDHLLGRPIQMNHHRIRTDCSDYGTAQISRLRFLCGSGLLSTAEQYIKTDEGTKEVSLGDRMGKIPLYYVFERAALFKSDNEMADFTRYLLQLGVDPNTKPGQHYDTPLELTLKKHLDKCADCLIDGGAHINPKDSQKDPLTVLVSRKPENVERVRWLLSKGARPVTHAPIWTRLLFPTLFAGLGNCALMEAVRMASPQMVEILFRYVKRRDLDAKDATDLVREAIDLNKYGNLAVILASRQIRRVVAKHIVTLVQDMLADLGRQQSEDDNSGVLEKEQQDKEIKRIAELVEELSANVQGRFRGTIRRCCCC